MPAAGTRLQQCMDCISCMLSSSITRRDEVFAASYALSHTGTRLSCEHCAQVLTTMHCNTLPYGWHSLIVICCHAQSHLVEQANCRRCVNTSIAIHPHTLSVYSARHGCAASCIVVRHWPWPGPAMYDCAGEDFSFFCRKVPCTLGFLGTRNESIGAVHALHNPRCGTI